MTRFPANESPRRTGLNSSLLAKSSFYLPSFKISSSCCTAPDVYISNQFQTTYVHLGWRGRRCELQFCSCIPVILLLFYTVKGLFLTLIGIKKLLRDHLARMNLARNNQTFKKVKWLILFRIIMYRDCIDQKEAIFKKMLWYI